MTPEQMALRALAEQATPGPWWPAPYYKSDVQSGTGVGVVAQCRPMNSPAAVANAAYIAAAHPTAVLALLAALAAREAEAAGLRNALERINAYPTKHLCSSCGLDDEQWAWRSGYNEALRDIANVASAALAPPQPAPGTEACRKRDTRMVGLEASAPTEDAVHGILCGDCQGTGHSGNLVDELCPTCAGGKTR